MHGCDHQDVNRDQARGDRVLDCIHHGIHHCRHTRNDNPIQPVGATPAILASQVSLHESVGSVGATVPFGAWTFLGQYGHLRDSSTYNSGLSYGNPRTNYYSAGFRYSLSKRTVLYAAYSRFNNKTGTQGQAQATPQKPVFAGQYNA